MLEFIISINSLCTQSNASQIFCHQFRVEGAGGSSCYTRGSTAQPNVPALRQCKPAYSDPSIGAYASAPVRNAKRADRHERCPNGSECRQETYDESPSVLHENVKLHHLCLEVAAGETMYMVRHRDLSCPHCGFSHRATQWHVRGSILR